MKHRLNTVARAIMVACFALASVSAFASSEDAICAHARAAKSDSCNVERYCNANACDSINMIVYLVDGVEVQAQALNEIPTEDIEKVEIVKDHATKRIFSPRLGGIILITTKSKRFLNPLLENHNRMIKENRQNRIPGQLIIRGDSTDLSK